MKLSFGGTFRPIVEVEPNSIRLSSLKNADTGEIVTIKSERKDFKISEVYFNASGGGGKEMDWKSNIPLQFALLGPDTTKKTTKEPVKESKETVKPKKDTVKSKQEAVEKQKEPQSYRVRISFKPFDKEDRYGEFVIKTNIPEKPEVKLSGVIEGKKQ